MPELPEVQTTVNGIQNRLIGKKIIDVWTDYNSPFHKHKPNIKNPEFFATLKKVIVGSTIVKAERRAKIVIIHLSNGISVLTHMKMTGHYIVGTWKKTKKSGKTVWVAEPGTPAHDDSFNGFIHFILTFADGSMLGFSDMRKFAHITHTETATLHNHPLIGKLGPEPLDPSFSKTILEQQLLKKPQGKIKSVLMDQEVIAGIGNIYSDEILWLSGIDPRTVVRNIPKKLFTHIHKAIVATLSQGIDFGGDSMSDYRNIDGARGAFQHQHNAYRKTGKPCTKKGCTGTIRRIIIGGRSTHFCDTHQKQYT